MFHVELLLHDAQRRQAALRAPAAPAAAHPATPARERLGGWLVRLGQAVAGRPVSATAWQR
jgi:hypothetical protein